MLVYGDPRRSEETAAKLEGLRAILARLATTTLRIERHAVLAELLVEAGELEQGVLDHQLAEVGEERPSPWVEAVSRLTRSVAEVLLPSFRTFGALPPSAVAPIERALAELAAADLPKEVSVTVPEGFAFYGLYPETYFAAAEALRGEAVRVIGIRSIGTSLGAAVAAGVREATVVSVRPGGHPFTRKLSVGQRVGRELLDGKGVYALVDEGPGLSGSSFGSVADWLEDRGVDPAAISFFPSHRGALGPYASERHRLRWERSERHVVDFEDLFASPKARWPLAKWVEDLTGPAEAPLEDLGAGRWRKRLFPDRSRWPAADVQGERRKYLLNAGGRRWLLKFAGLGRYGREKLAFAAALQEAGLIPPVSGLRHGFLVGPWLEGARPLPLAPEIDRLAVLDAVARYLAFRVENFPSTLPGASPEALFEMAAFNTQRALGPGVAGAVRGWQGHLPELASLARPVLTDNKMHAWEWLVTAEGRILKADALDHHRGNDLVGPQDPAWDLAGAAVELDLDDRETGLLCEAVARRSGTAGADPLQIGFYTVAYLAFQLGRHSLAAEALEHSAPADAAGMRREMERYAARLRRALG
jgi:hypothetical protein